MEHHHVCPWWMGYLLASPLRRLGQNPNKILAPYIREGMTVLEPGPGMGFFTLELARLVGRSGRVIAMDIQPQMLKTLEKRARKANLHERITLRRAETNRMGVDDLKETADFVFAFALVHELPDAAGFFTEMFAALKPQGRMLLSEPSGHVSETAWQETQTLAQAAGFQQPQSLNISRSRTVLLLKP